MPRFLRRHDIYDDTPYGHQSAPDYIPPHEYPPPPRHHRSHRRRNHPFYDYPSPPSHGLPPMPLNPYHPIEHWPSSHHPPPPPHHSMQPFFPVDPFITHGNQSMERDLTPFGVPSFFRGMMNSIDRMWEDMASSFPHPSQFEGDGHYFYESKTRTVGPDGNIVEETFTTVPGVDGQPQTRRIVRQGEDGSTMRSVFDTHVPNHSNHNDQVLVEEIDDDGNVIRQDYPSTSTSTDEDNMPYHQPNSDNWFRNQYRRLRSRD